MTRLRDSKKAKVTGLAAVAVVIVSILLELVEAPQEVIEWVTGSIIALAGFYNIGQGMSDFGKEAAKVTENE